MSRRQWFWSHVWYVGIIALDVVLCVYRILNDKFWMGFFYGCAAVAMGILFHLFRKNAKVEPKV